ncbi:hypothetical protein HMPREF1983_00450 [Gemella bergeri ATCC 700627]|uniref:DUF2929 domain-containing protein n=1 Tax=Gemella bergeri ATCC 700627 TaxID=1321820 RepID=U2S1K0_9BACL|nr:MULTISPECIES: DUF2929 family protein [Gemella]AME09442.1 hypothetical protein AXE85_04420 [Gemella sp. oral taxon 928]AXI27080.1 DUF2929 domain-containing protein [Gemella sp. ND 6198]ERK59618.1 hypothetical protein HMPREF1983_00450 [Gemella bergeri ATCC 700627]
MRFLVSLIWAFIFSFVAIFIITSILGSNGQSYSVQNCAILAVIFTVAVALLELLGFDRKRSE